MTQQDRDRLVALKKARKRLITQRQAAAEIGQSERHIRRLLVKLKSVGDRAVVHELRGRVSNRQVEGKVKEAALTVLGQEVYGGFGPKLASEYLSQHQRYQCEPRDRAGLDDRGQVVASQETAHRKDSTNGARGGPDGASSCSGTPATTSGWSSVGQSCS